MSAWQPIETAPKDGTVIQVWTDLGEWRPWTSFNDYERRWFSVMEMTGEPTRWMPLPSPPEGT
jgi:hypothetical protein